MLTRENERLEHELGELLSTLGFASRQRRALSLRLGWDGGRPATLTDAGRATGYTRERVRQLQQALRERIRRARPTLPTTRAALAVVGEAAPGSREEIAHLIADAGLSLRPFDAGGVLAAAEIAGFDADIVIESEAVLRRDHLVLAPVVAQVVRSLVAQRGATTAAEVARTTGVSVHEVDRLLRIDEGVRWMSDWLTVEPLTGRIGSALRKIASVSTNADAGDVQRALAGLRPPVHLPLDVVASLFAHVTAEQLDGELSPTERLLVDHLRASGGSVRVAHAAPSGVLRQTAAVCLSRSPLFRRVERGRWALAV